MKGEVFSEIRQTLGMTQVRLAARLGFNPRTIQAWEGGSVQIPRLVAAIMWIELERGGMLDLLHEYERGRPENLPSAKMADWPDDGRRRR